MRFSANAIAALAFILNVAPALAQSAAPMPTDQEIKEGMERHRRGLVELGVTPAPGQPSRIAPVAPGTFKTDIPLPVKPAAPIKKDDLGAMIKKFQDYNSGVIPEELTKTGDVIIFASLSMPRQTLKELSRQAGEMGAVVVLRGLKDGSVDKTRIAAEEVNPTGTGWQIHPELFKAFKVTKVPTFVVANAASGNLLEDGCAPDATYASVSGDISLNAALETIRRRAQPAIAQLANLKLEEFKRQNQQKSVVR